MQTILAKCENCGGALRIESGAQSAECLYCGATSYVQVPAAETTAPRLRIDPPPPVSNGAKNGLIAMGLFGALAVLMLTIAAFETGKDRTAMFGFGGAFVVITALAGLGTLGASESYRQELWFRENAVPGRATVREIAIANDGAARLTLEIQVAGRSPRQVVHTTTVPALLVPRLTQGLSLPVIVHPDDGSKLAIQWHLV